MRSRSIVPLGLILVLSASNGRSAELRLGLAVEDITPPVGYRMCGYFSERPSTGVLDPLQARCLVLAQGETRVVLVFCDLIGMEREVVDRAREAASKKTGIPPGNMAIAATHSHTGPLYFDVLRDHFHDVAVARDGKDAREEVDYPRLLEERLVAVIEKASAALRPVHLQARVQEQSPQLNFNRRFHMKNGSVVFNPGQQNPEIVRAAGPIDPEVSLLLFRDSSEGTPLASLAVFALHLDTLGGTLFSADYPGVLEQELRKALGAGFFSAFGAGTCGDLNHIDVSVKGVRPTREIGAALARTVLAAIGELGPARRPAGEQPVALLAVRRRTLELELQQVTGEQVAGAKRDLFRVGTPELSFLEQVRACTVADLARLGGKVYPVEVQAFRLARDVALVTLPGEVFVEHGLAIKRRSPFKTTLVVELANSCPAYVPTRKAFEEGSYETVNSRLVPGSGEKMVETALELLGELAK